MLKDLAKKTEKNDSFDALFVMSPFVPFSSPPMSGSSGSGDGSGDGSGSSGSSGSGGGGSGNKEANECLRELLRTNEYLNGTKKGKEDNDA